MAFNINVIVEAEAVESSSEITQDYGLSESMVWCWRRDQVIILSGKLKMSAKHAEMDHFTPKCPKLDEYLFLNPKPSAISWTPFLVKKSPNFCVKYWKNCLAYRWRNTVTYGIFHYIIAVQSYCIIEKVVVHQCGQYTLYINYNIFPGFLVTLTVDLSVLSTYCKSPSVISSQGDTFTVELIDWRRFCTMQLKCCNSHWKWLHFEKW